MLGNVDSGKTTTTAVLISKQGDLDDGRGTKRKQVFNFQHEINNGRTSSIGHEIMGFNHGKQYFTKFEHTTQKNKIWPDIVQNSDEIVHLLDMCGHEKYLKTTMFGLTSLYPDYACIMVGGNMGISKMTKEHIGIALTLNLPIFVVFTKTDIAPQNVLNDNLKLIARIMKDNCAKVPILMKDDTNVDKVTEKLTSGKVCPVFQISNATGAGVETLRNFIGKLQKPLQAENKMNVGTDDQITTQFVIDDKYVSKGLGLILCGTVLKGCIQIGQTMMFGPDRYGNFKQIIVKDMQENRVPITMAKENQQCTLKVKAKDNIKNTQIRKGSFLINQIEKKVKGLNAYNSVCVKYFNAKIKVNNHHTTIQEGYNSVIHIGGVRQTVEAVKLDKDCLRVGDTGNILFKFKYGVEIVKYNQQLILREGATKAVGFITNVYGMNIPQDEVINHFFSNNGLKNE